MSLIGGSPQIKDGDNDGGFLLHLGQGNVFREFSVIHRGTKNNTSIGNNNYIMTHAVINHDSVIGDNNTICTGVSISGHCFIGNMVNIGTNSALHQYVAIGDYVMIGMMAPVTKHVPPFSLLNPKYSEIKKLNLYVIKDNFTPEEIDGIYKFYQFILDDWSNYKEALVHMGSALSRRVIQTMNRFRYQQLERPQIKTFTVLLS